MMKRIILGICLIIVALAILIIIQRWKNDLIREGRRQVAYEEFSWSLIMLKQASTNDPFREHLKAMVYYYANDVPDETLKKLKDIDFGPVNEAMLGNYRVAPPHTDSPNDFYNAMTNRLKK